jgi:hypothetical protein
MTRAAWVWGAALVAVLGACDGGDGSEDAGDSDEGGDGGRDSGMVVVSCVGAADGTACAGGICVGGECGESRCDDGYVDTAAGEDCEDGNDIAFDGCEPDDCTFTCDAAEDCIDDDVCDGVEVCTSEHVCDEGEPAADGTPCSTDDVADGVCHPLPTPICQVAECGNGVRDTDEDCDDGRNGDDTDACGDDCLLSCRGTTAGCVLEFSPTTFHDFGMVAEGATSTEFVFTVQNASDATPIIPTVQIVGADASQFQFTTTCTLRINEFASCTITVTFVPSGAGHRQAMLVIDAGDGWSGAAELRGFALGGLGDACTADTECAGGACVDGVCCNEGATSCTGCRACNLSGSEGTCSNVPSGEDPHGACTGLECATGTCGGDGECAAGQGGTVCQDDGCIGRRGCSSCPNDSHVVHVCDGASTGCPTTTRLENCPDGNVCADATSCRTSCTSDAECYSGYFCDGSVCRAALSVPSSCTRNRQCNTNICQGGMCRNCVTNGECQWSNSNLYCQSTADGANRCVRCSDAGGDAFCVAEGLGDRCVNNFCQCSSSGQCTNPEAPNCLGMNSGAGIINVCACYSYSTVNSTVYSCNWPLGPTCVGNYTGTDHWEGCKITAGQPCTSNYQCLSGFCNAGVCGA